MATVIKQKNVRYKQHETICYTETLTYCRDRSFWNSKEAFPEWSLCTLFQAPQRSAPQKEGSIDQCRRLERWCPALSSRFCRKFGKIQLSSSVTCRSSHLRKVCHHASTIYTEEWKYTFNTFESSRYVFNLSIRELQILAIRRSHIFDRCFSHYRRNMEHLLLALLFQYRWYG